MTKESYNRWLNKNERNRLRRQRKAKHAKLHPNWEGGMIDRPHVHARMMNA